MDINQASFSSLIEKLEGLDWCFFSGFAVKLYADRKRKCGDLDIMVRNEDLHKFAKRLGTEVRRRTEKKDTFRLNDIGFETDFKGLDIEATSGFPRKRFKEKLLGKVFKKSVKKNFFGETVYLTPIEDLIVHKASMLRVKDRKDLKLLKNEEYDTGFIKELAEDWGESKRILENLTKVGFVIEG